MFSLNVLKHMTLCQDDKRGSEVLVSAEEYTTLKILAADVVHFP